MKWNVPFPKQPMDFFPAMSAHIKGGRAREYCKDSQEDAFIPFTYVYCYVVTVLTYMQKDQMASYGNGKF